MPGGTVKSLSGLISSDGVEICTGKGDMNLYGFSSEFP